MPENHEVSGEPLETRINEVNVCEIVKRVSENASFLWKEYET